jgi:hypothetical protein
MPARKLPSPDEKPQRERFIEAARDIGASEDPEEFERAFRKIMSRRPSQKPPKKKISSQTDDP